MRIFLSTTAKKISLTFLSAFFTILSVQAEENKHDLHQQLMREAYQFVASKIQPLQTASTSGVKTNIDIAPFDKRLRIPACPSSFQFSTQADVSSQANVTVKATCDGSPWYLYFVAKVTRSQKIVVAKYSLSPDTIITEDQLAYADINVQLNRQTLHYEKQDVIGTKVKRRLRAGQPITANNLCFVCKGDNVTIMSGSKMLNVKTLGAALQDGKLGDTISVTNQRSGKRIRARVTGIGEVIVGS